MNSFAASETFIPRGHPLPPIITAAEFSFSKVEWCMFFASVYSLQEHPGMSREDAHPKTISECAKIADQMLLEFRMRMQRGIE